MTEILAGLAYFAALVAVLLAAYAIDLWRRL